MSENSALSAENKVLKELNQRFQNLEQETKRGFAVMQVQLDKLFNLLTSKTFRNNAVTVEENTKKEDSVLDQKKIEFPLKSVEQLDLLEKELSNVDFEKVLVKKFSKISGTSGTHKIGKVGLQISKAFFTDELLSKFTWKGIKGSTKPPFMPYTNIRNGFYKIAHLADDSCTALEVDSFLQNSAIKHSSQRIKRKSSENIVGKSKKKRTETNNGIGENSSSSNNIKPIYNLNEEENQEMPNQEEENFNSEMPNKVEEESLKSETPNNEEVKDLNLETPNKKEVENSYPKASNKKEEYESEDHLNKEKNEIDDDTPGMKKCNIKASKLVTVLSDVKIINKVMDLKLKSKAVNISSDNLSNSHLFD